MNEFLLPHEVMDGAGVPNAYRDIVAYKIVAGKYCALVEAVMRDRRGEPVRISMERVKQIVSLDETSDPRTIPMVAEDPAGDHDHILVRLATVDEIVAANRRYGLSRMGPRRN